MICRKILIVICIVIGGHISTRAQVGFGIGNEFAVPLGQSCVPITVSGFQDVIGFQFSMQWESDELQIDSIGNFGLVYLDENDFNLSNSSSGGLSVIWDDGSLNGQDLSDNSILFEICFTANGNPQDTLDVSFAEIPTPAVVTQFDGMNLDESVPIQINGSIIIISALFLDSEEVIDVNCFEGADGSISVQIGGGIHPYNYTWEISEPDTNAVFNLNVGLYNLTVTDQLQDTLVLSFTIDQPDNPIVIDSIQLPELTCVDSIGMVFISASGGNPPFTFAMNNELSNDGVFQNIEAGVYSLEIIDSNNCQISESINVDPPLLALAMLTGDTLSCGNPIELQVNEGFEIYEWLKDGIALNDIQNSLTVTSSGYYEVNVTNEDLCQSTAGLSIFFAPQIEVSIEAQTYEGCTNDTLILTPQGAATYNWIGSNFEIESDQSAVFSVNQTGVYVLNVVGEDEFNCFLDSTSIELFIMEPLGYAGVDTCIREGDEVQLNSFAGVEYLWQENEFDLDDRDIPNPISMPDSSTFYVVEITDELGCINVDTVNVTVIVNPLEFLKPINLITPNGDGENDFLVFDILDKFPQNQLVVFNRWGNIVYQTLGYDNRWDGTFKGDKLPSGEYFYILTISEQELKSTLTILND